MSCSRIDSANRIASATFLNQWDCFSGNVQSSTYSSSGLPANSVSRNGRASDCIVFGSLHLNSESTRDRTADGVRLGCSVRFARAVTNSDLDPEVPFVVAAHAVLLRRSFF